MKCPLQLIEHDGMAYIVGLAYHTLVDALVDALFEHWHWGCVT
jgi:hypothetical protein